MLRVQITNRQDAMKPDRARLRRACRAAAPEAWGDVAVSLAVVDDDEIARINEQYLGRPNATDVIAFALDGPDASERPTVGEIVVSAERALAEAARRDADPQWELALYAAHGVLHLAGYDDHNPAERREMRLRESEALRAAGLSDEDAAKMK